MQRLPPHLTRTSSAVSTSSDDAVSTSSRDSTARRTRKRFSHVQLMMLEQLYHKNTHPTRDERESLAKAGGMEIKSVTIWLQNKRQTERKVALQNSTNLAKTSRKTVRSSSSPFTSATTSRSSTSSSSSRPSLDNIASRSELRAPPPRTPSRRHYPNTTLWDNMPSSPIAPPFSPPAREYVEFGKNTRTRTLEWACAAARLAEKDGAVQGRDRLEILDEGDTEDEFDEAITPGSTWEGGDTKWTTEPGGKMTVLHKGVQDDDMMRAALALCGLGRQ